MITCKIILNNQPDVDYNMIIDKILNNGNFLISAMDQEYEILFASDKDEIDENYIRKALRKYKVDFMIHTYSLKEKFDFDSYNNQWIVANLDRQLKIQIEREQQPQLQELSRKLDLLNKVTDAMIEAKNKYEAEALKIQQKEENNQKTENNK